MEQHITHAVITVGKANAPIILRLVFHEPRRKLIQFGDRIMGAFLPLPRPAIDLTLEIVAGPSEIAKANLVRASSVHLGHGISQTHPQRAAL